MLGAGAVFVVVGMLAAHYASGDFWIIGYGGICAVVLGAVGIFVGLWQIVTGHTVKDIG